MSIEQYANNPITTLNGSINNSVTTLTVISASLFSTSGNFRILIDSEIMLVTAVSGTTFTVTRGVEGTSGASHTSGATITGILTAQALENLRAEGATTGSFSSPIGASRAGRVWLPQDAPYIVLADGSNLNYFGPMYKMTPPDNTLFSWVNQGGASVSTANGGVYLSAPAAASANLRLRVKTPPATPYTITTYSIPDLLTPGDSLAGLAFRESGTGKIEAFYNVYSQGLAAMLLAVVKWDSVTSFNNNRAFLETYKVGELIRWLRLINDGTTLTYQYSVSGYTWYTFASALKNNFFTTGPDQVGIVANGSASANAAGLHLLSWLEQ